MCILAVNWGGIYECINLEKNLLVTLMSTPRQMIIQSMCKDAKWFGHVLNVSLLLETGTLLGKYPR